MTTCYRCLQVWTYDSERHSFCFGANGVAHAMSVAIVRSGKHPTTLMSFVWLRANYFFSC